ncbi:MAG: D-alanyl-D-alanine carboxypeptidase [Xanthobacteraceae bacterium]|nr:MAG: D-alanyl-D-alanine carboxypeptidase [Xanthobacteraceae bacterium]
MNPIHFSRAGPTPLPAKSACVIRFRQAAASLALLATLCAAPLAARAEALLLIEAASGKVLHAEHATNPWYPASVTKLMTAYLTLKAVKEQRLSFDTLLTVSPTAVAQQPSKMGFAAGTQVTVDNALKMMMVKSANDMAVVLAEGVSGSIEAFADDMNRAAQRLGMTQTSYVNPNGLPAEGQVTSARDLALLARAIYHDLPEYESYMSIPAIKFGRRVTRNFNSLIGRYPGADGMKTGFICASGFNLVASATRDGKRLIAVVLGSPSSGVRAVKAAQLFERGFSGNGLSWLTPSLGTVDALPAVEGEPPNLRDEMCGPKRKRPAADSLDDEADSGQGVSLFAGLRNGPKPSELLSAPGAVQAVVVYAGPKRPDGARAIVEAETQKPARRSAAAKPKAEAKDKLAQRHKDAARSKQATRQQAKSETKPGAKPQAKPEAKSETRPKPAAAKPPANPKDKAKDKSKDGTKVSAKTEAKTEVKTEAKSTAKPGVRGNSRGTARDDE